MYTEWDFIEALQKTNFSLDLDFYDENTIDLIDSLRKHLPSGWTFSTGATKCVLIPKKEDFVIKIPYSGTTIHEYSWTDTSGEHFPESIDFYPFENGEDENRPWDYCANEVLRYAIAAEEGFSEYFAETKFLTYVRGFPIYTQKKCDIFSENRKNHSHSLEMNQITQNTFNEPCFSVCADWLTDFRLAYGNVNLVTFFNFLDEKQWNDDLRTENIGYLNGCPVLVDYSSFLE